MTAVRKSRLSRSVVIFALVGVTLAARPKPVSAQCIYCEDAPTAYCGYLSYYHYHGSYAFFGVLTIAQHYCHDGSSCYFSDIPCWPEFGQLSALSQALAAKDLESIEDLASIMRLRIAVSTSRLEVLACDRETAVASVTVGPDLLWALKHSLNSYRLGVRASPVTPMSSGDLLTPLTFWASDE